jgi:predicted phosphodiesterase
MGRKRFVIVGDNHGNEIDTELEPKFFAWLKDFNPQLRIHAGDCFNFAALRRKASDAEKAEALSPDIEAGKDFLRKFFSGGEENHFLRGNHDERIYFLTHEAHDARLRELGANLCRDIEAHVRKLRARMLPYDKRAGVLDTHGVRVIHGFSAGVNAARKFAATYGTCAFAHTHSMDVVPFERWPSPVTAYGTGCLCVPDQGYNAAQIGALRHEQGWLYGFTDENHATYHQARHQNGRVAAATDFRCY